MTILGLDLSLSAVGWATICPPASAVGTYHPPTAGCIGSRLLAFDEWLLNVLEEHRPTVVAIESPVVRTPAAVKLGMVHGVCHRRLAWWSAPHNLTIIDVPPAVVKKLATGKGNADKAAVRGAARSRLGYTGESDDEADAMWVAHAAAYLGDATMLPALPAVNMAALDKLAPKP